MVQLGAWWGVGGKVLFICLPRLFKLLPEKERKRKQGEI